MPLKFDSEQMRTVAKSLDSGALDVRSIVDRLKGEVDNLVGDGFSGGSGSTQFDSLYNDWDLHAKNLLETLTGISQALGRTGDDIDNVDADFANRFSG